MAGLQNARHNAEFDKCSGCGTFGEFKREKGSKSWRAFEVVGMLLLLRWWWLRSRRSLGGSITAVSPCCCWWCGWGCGDDCNLDDCQVGLISYCSWTVLLLVMLLVMWLRLWWWLWSRWLPGGSNYLLQLVLVVVVCGDVVVVVEVVAVVEMFVSSMIAR